MRIPRKEKAGTRTCQAAVTLEPGSSDGARGFHPAAALH